MFADLQEAMDWGLKRLGGDSFRIKYISVARIESEDDATVGNDAVSNADSGYEEPAEELGAEELFPRGRLLS